MSTPALDKIKPIKGCRVNITCDSSKQHGSDYPADYLQMINEIVIFTIVADRSLVLLYSDYNEEKYAYFRNFSYIF